MPKFTTSISDQGVAKGGVGASTGGGVGGDVGFRVSVSNVGCRGAR